ncbi:MAG: TonB-dependent receptor [Gammaproteobacteria bacterium]|nr:TonB-dependent receptor [Gammaproteobacteria bacterium]
MKKINFRLIIGCALILASFAGIRSTGAQPVEAETEDLLELSFADLLTVDITIATGTEQSIARASAVASVITAKDIEAMGAATVAEALVATPGLHIGKSVAGYQPLYNMRGSPDDYTLTLINGIPVTTLYWGPKSLIWKDMPISDIARIEIIRGPGGAVYGADAMAGVVNIITKTAKDIDGIETGVRAGSFDTQSAWVLYGGKQGGFDVALSVDYHTTDGFHSEIEADAQTSMDTMFGTNASFAPGSASLSVRNIEARADVSRGLWRLRAGYQGWRDYGMGVGLAGSLDPIGRYANDHYNADLTWHDPKAGRYWDITAQASYLDTGFHATRHVRLFPPGAFGGAYPQGYIGSPGVFERHVRLNLSAFYSGFDKHAIRMGGGGYYGDLYKVLHFANYGPDPATGIEVPPGSPVLDSSDTPYAFLPEKIRRSWHLFLQDVYTITPDWEFTAGLRYDRYSDLGFTWNPRLALIWQINPHLTSKILYGRAFLAPTFDNLYHANNPVFLGNPNLKPETSETWEMAFNYRAAENLNLALNLFSYSNRDIIGAINEEDIVMENFGEQNGRGMEFEAKWQPGRNFNITGNFAVMRVMDKDSDSELSGVARHQAYLRAEWRFLPHWHFNSQVNFIGKRKRWGDEDGRPSLDDYTTLDLVLRRKEIIKRWEFAVSVRNLFNADVREPEGPSIPSDLPQAKRNYYAELLYRF